MYAYIIIIVIALLSPASYEEEVSKNEKQRKCFSLHPTVGILHRKTFE